MAISSVGSFFNNGTSGATMSMPSGAAIGDLAVVQVISGAATAGSSVTLSGGGVTTWNQVAWVDNGGTLQGAYLFWGIVTATGGGTLTESGSSSIAMAGMYFHSSVSTWSVDVGSGQNTQGTGTAASGNYPSLTGTYSVGVNELYVGGGAFKAGTPGGSTAGFTYNSFYKPSTTFYGQFVYQINTSLQTAYSPAWTQTSSNGYVTTSAIISDAPPPVPIGHDFAYTYAAVQRAATR